MFGRFVNVFAVRQNSLIGKIGNSVVEDKFTVPARVINVCPVLHYPGKENYEILTVNANDAHLCLMKFGLKPAIVCKHCGQV